jgi:hypothetical protein
VLAVKQFCGLSLVFLPLTYVRGSVTHAINCGAKYFYLVLIISMQLELPGAVIIKGVK